MANKSLAKDHADICVLVTGGAGFIGSHTCVELLDQGYHVVVVDDLSNSSELALDRVRQITGLAANDDRLKFYEANILDRAALDRVFSENDVDAIIHFAGFKAVGESVPKHDATNPYGWTKSMLEQVLTDLYVGDDEWNVVLLRYFNPIGAHESGLIGEDPKGIPNNLLPYVAQVAVGKLESVGVFGDDCPTHDGTGVRDYIHVVDLARGHVCAIKKLQTNCGLFICNLGTGHGYSVLDVIHAFEKACGKKLPYVIDPRRPGDIAECYADPTKAKNELGWVAEYGIEEMCADSWNWQKNNPDGYHTVK